MSRRKREKKRKILPDPKFKNELVAKFINIVMERGKKSVAEKIVYGALNSAKDKLKDKIRKGKATDDDDSDGTSSGAPELILFGKAIENVSPIVEVKSRRIGGSTYQIPVEVNADRQMTLAMRWIVEAAKKRPEKHMELRLGSELSDAFLKRGSAIKKKEEMHRMAEANKAFAHFR